MFTGLISLATLGIALYALMCLLLYFKQESILFYPVQNDPMLSAQYKDRRITIPSHGQTLEGWWLRSEGEERLILYFGGNAEDVLYSAAELYNLNLGNVLVVNYRGYGHSTGEPTQDALYQDALTIYEYAIARGVDPKQISVVGRSLGSGVASMLAGSRSVAAVVLVTPFDNLAAVAADHYRYFPVRLLLRHPFPSEEWARKTQAPALIMAAELDEVVPPTHARGLFKAWAGPKQFEMFKGVGHNDIDQTRDYYVLMQRFLAAHVQ
ncbi:MAG: alpha/beta hydrolase [Povalibacter sp.]